MIEKKILEKVTSQILEKKQPILQTGFSDLDSILSGLENSSIITIGARPSMGKTAFITAIMLNLLEQKKKCLLFSLEMSKSQFIKRLIPPITEIEATKIYANQNQLNSQENNEITSAIEKISNFDLTIVDTSADIEQIKEHIESIKPEIVFIDYLQLIKLPNDVERDFAISNFMKELKVIAKQNNCIVFITSQLSRKVERRDFKWPMLCDLKESGSLEDISDVVLFVYREEYYNREDEYYKDKAQIIVAKNKNGFAGTVDLLFKANIIKFLEAPCNDTF